MPTLARMRFAGAFAALLATFVASPALANAPAISEERSRATQALVEARSFHPRQVHDHAESGGREYSLLLRELAIRYHELRPAQRARARSLLSRPTDSGYEGAGDGPYAPGAEQRVSCSVHFCLHWVTSTEDAPDLTDANVNAIPDYVESMSAEFEYSYLRQNGPPPTGLGWKTPRADGTRGGDVNKSDVYIKNLGHGLYGYVSPDPGQRSLAMTAFQVMDNDYAPAHYDGADPTVSMRVTVAHEYNHMVQMAYNFLLDPWMLEATATWMEDQVHDDLNDYLRYLPLWGKTTGVPLTRYGQSSRDPATFKVYGSAVWNHWLEGRFGASAIRGAMEAGARDKEGFAVGAYDNVIKRSGGRGFSSEFAAFAAASAEWQRPGSGFSEGSTYPTLNRARSLSANRQVKLRLDNTSFALLNVRAPRTNRLRLAVWSPLGTTGALALVGRRPNGTAVTKIKLVAAGGGAVVSLERPRRFARITAVVVNADAKPLGMNPASYQWMYKDDGAFRARVVAGNKPVAPANLRVARRTRSSVVLRWDSMAERGGYVLSVRAEGTTKWRKLARTKVAATRLAGLRPGSRYSFRVATHEGSRVSGPSPVLNVRTKT